MRTFENVPVDPDTTIMAEHEVAIEGLPALMQQWKWSGFIAETVIFHSDDIADLDDTELFKLVKKNCIVGEDKRHTVIRSESGYTFVNYNFEDMEDLMYG